MLAVRIVLATRNPCPELLDGWTALTIASLVREKPEHADYTDPVVEVAARLSYVSSRSTASW